MFTIFEVNRRTYPLDHFAWSSLRYDLNNLISPNPLEFTKGSHIYSELLKLPIHVGVNILNIFRKSIFLSGINAQLLKNDKRKSLHYILIYNKTKLE